jgi:hypothetical protein
MAEWGHMAARIAVQRAPAAPADRPEVRAAQEARQAEVPPPNPIHPATHTHTHTHTNVHTYSHTYVHTHTHTHTHRERERERGRERERETHTHTHHNTQVAAAVAGVFGDAAAMERRLGGSETAYASGGPNGGLLVPPPLYDRIDPAVKETGFSKKNE